MIKNGPGILSSQVHPRRRLLHQARTSAIGQRVNMAGPDGSARLARANAGRLVQGNDMIVAVILTQGPDKFGVRVRNNVSAWARWCLCVGQRGMRTVCPTSSREVRFDTKWSPTVNANIALAATSFQISPWPLGRKRRLKPAVVKTADPRRLLLRQMFEPGSCKYPLPS